MIKVIVDSGCDLPDEIRDQYHIDVVPLTVSFEDEHYKDKIDLDWEAFYKKMAQTPQLPKTASPSPQEYLDRFICKEKDIIVVCVTAKLSGTWNAAKTARNLFHQSDTTKNIHIIDSMSASIGEGLVALQAARMALEGITTEQIVKRLSHYVQQLNTIFVLDSLDNLVKGGRLDKIRAAISSVLSIKLIMGEKEGQIEVKEKVHGMKKALKRLVEMIGEQAENIPDKVLGIAHSNCLERALEVKKMISERYSFREIIITTMGPTIGTHAGEGGILISF